MGRLNVTLLRYLNSEEFRVLTAVEMGMKNHEVVPAPLVASIASLKHGGVHKVLMKLCRSRLLVHEQPTKFVAGYRLSRLGYDYLALKTLTSRDVLSGLGRQIGVGKEADVYAGQGVNGDPVCLKFHRLGRTSFKQLKLKRDYHKARGSMNWLYLSRLASMKEFAFMSALHEHKFPVPKPIDCNRHCIVMSLVEGYPLAQIHELANPAAVWENLMAIMIRFVRYGLIHSDFNEFNILISEDDSVTVIDFPQCVSTSHPNAEEFFERDVQCLAEFFERRFSFTGDVPIFSSIPKTESLDAELKATGYREAEMAERMRDLAQGFHGDEAESDVTLSAEEESEEEEEVVAEIKTEEQRVTQAELLANFRALKATEEPQLPSDTAVQEEPLCDAAEVSPTGRTQRRDSSGAGCSSDDESTHFSCATSRTSVPPEVIRERVRRQLKSQQARVTNKKTRTAGTAAIKNKSKRETHLDTRAMVEAVQGW